MKDTFLCWLAYKLPKKLVYFCVIRVFANATTGKYGKQMVSELTFIEAINRWEEI